MPRTPDHGERMGAPIYVKFPPEIDRLLRNIAADEMRPISSLLRKIVMSWLADQPRRKLARSRSPSKRSDR